MSQLLSTRISLLARLRDPGDVEAWRQFVRLYAPLVYRYGRRHGLQDADAADLTQDVLRAVSASVSRFDYDRQRGSFRSWLLTLAHHKLYDFLARQRRQTPGSGDSALRLHTLRGSGREIINLAFSPDGQSRAAGDQEGTVSLWEVNTRKLQHGLHNSADPVWCVAFSPDGKTLATAQGSWVR